MPSRRVAYSTRNLIALAGCAVIAAGCADSPPAPLTGRPKPPASVIASVKWLPLPTDGFVSGRPADKDDVTAGRAALSAISPGRQAPTPIPNAVPQYAFHIDESGKRTPGFVIQAEQAGTLRMIGFRSLADNQLFAATEQEFEFLGTDVPTEQGDSDFESACPALHYRGTTNDV